MSELYSSLISTLSNYLYTYILIANCNNKLDTPW